jgi:hypothetical protein
LETYAMHRAVAAALLATTLAAPAAARSRGWIDLLPKSGLTGWHLRHTGENGWRNENGQLVNTPPSTDLVSDQTFGDFDLHVEYMFPKGSNSGVYLRGRYEVQIQDDAGRDPEEHINGAIYGLIKPKTNPTRPAGEWQTLDVRLVGNRVTVKLNGVKTIDNQEISGPTGGALDDRVGDPGPVMLQGDHGVVTFRSVRIKPIAARKPRARGGY